MNKERLTVIVLESLHLVVDIMILGCIGKDEMKRVQPDWKGVSSVITYRLECAETEQEDRLPNSHERTSVRQCTTGRVKD